MIVMDSKKSVIVNSAIIGVIILGYLIVNFFTTPAKTKVVSFENVGLQVPLKPLFGDSSKTTTLKEYQGKSVLIHFWASWCEACAADQKVMERLAESYAQSGVKMIGIASSDTREAIEKTGVIKNTSFPQYLDESGNLALALGVKTLPQTILIDSEGRELIHLTRPFDPQQLEKVEKRLNVFAENSHTLHFALESSHGQTISESTLSHQVWVADFIFTSCPGICPTLTQKMHSLQETFKQEDHVKFVSVTVDPETDTKEALQAYEKKYHVDPDKWYFLRGTMKKVDDLLVNGFNLGTLDDPTYHSGQFILVDGSNHIKGYYDPDSTESFTKLKSDISALLKKQ